MRRAEYAPRQMATGVLTSHSSDQSRHYVWHDHDDAIPSIEQFQAFCVDPQLMTYSTVQLIFFTKMLDEISWSGKEFLHEENYACQEKNS